MGEWISTAVMLVLIVGLSFLKLRDSLVKLEFSQYTLYIFWISIIFPLKQDYWVHDPVNWLQPQFLLFIEFMNRLADCNPTFALLPHNAL